jgi:hypothetical protein
MQKRSRAKSTRPGRRSVTPERREACQRFPVRGKTRCKFHGGKSPETNQSARTHGLYSKALTDPQDVDAFNRHIKAPLADPKTALISSAALVHTQVERQARNAKDGLLVLERQRSRSVEGDGVVCWERNRRAVWHSPAGCATFESFCTQLRHS